MKTHKLLKVSAKQYVVLAITSTDGAAPEIYAASKLLPYAGAIDALHWLQDQDLRRTKRRAAL